MEFTRRELLAGIGGGTLAVGGLSLGRRAPAFTQYTYAAPDDDTADGAVRVAWYETYNGAFLENHAGTSDGFDATLDPATEPAYVAEATYVTDGSGPVVSVGNVLPGDRGTLVVGLEVVDREGAEPTDVWVRGALTADEENGRNGPELAGGDTTADDGELDEVALVELWRDGSPLGTCNGRKEFDEELEAPIVERAPFGDAFGSNADIGDADGVLVLEGLAVGALRCVALAWELPIGTDNRTQGDGLGFDLSFGAVPTGAGSPFPLGGAQ
jgi:hypothetical protein